MGPTRTMLHNTWVLSIIIREEMQLGVHFSFIFVYLYFVELSFYHVIYTEVCP